MSNMAPATPAFTSLEGRARSSASGAPQTHPREAPQQDACLDLDKKNEYSFFIPKLTRAALEDRRRHILAAAERCFARDGFHTTTIADVKKEARVSTGAIYTYFPNKETMIRAILERARDDRRRQLDGAGLERDRSAQALLLLDWVAGIFTDLGAHAARIDVNLWAESLRNKGVQQLSRRALRDAVLAVSTVVASRLPESPDASLDARSVAAVLIALFLGLEVETAVGVELDPGAIVRVLATLFGPYLAEARPAPPAKRGLRTSAAPAAKGRTRRP
jgi:AcrR family transcriptional regulator